ncbi:MULTISPECIES: sensor histidine kinase [unclassified Spirosoma]|uniref:sensor histidine kinase n=1 Tax=unclassified Spirosoma TaxID=2621999 RepID=UPI0009690B92|nr:MULTISPECIES: sensor histidine kinase [unclassified Spirosoma]MBN8822420.1 sensor histidine kinase [Spirosoma sp.]OJW73744.1 MAG: histidine kinase [Spirosoma sp. 48-14]
MTLHIPAFFNNRTRIRNLLYLTLWATMVFLNAEDPKKHTLIFDPLEISFSLTFWLAAWFEHAIVLTLFLNRRQIGWALLSSMGVVAGFIVTRYLLEQVFFWHVFGFTNYDPNISKLAYAWDNRFYAVYAVGLGLAFKVIEDWFVHQQERSELVNERNTAELAFLKSQVNPHFLFNTLNNIYSLAYTKSDAAPGAILKLSELMRYMLYDSNGQHGGTGRVPLSKEVDYLKNYVELEKLRVANANVLFSVEGNTDLFRIEPLLLVSFVENAFKHGDLADPNQPLVLDLSIRNGRLRFDTLNKKANRQTDASGGIGLTNVQRRLALLYPNQHTLHITNDGDSYACSLELTL